MSDAREKIRQKILADIKKRVDTYWSEIQNNDAGFSDTAKAASDEMQKWAAMDLKFLLEMVEMLGEEQRLWSDGTIVAKLSDLEAENERLAKCRHECKIECLLGEYEKLHADNTKLRAELEAAKRDMRELSGHYKICKFCMYDKGGGVSDCKDYKCDSENHYDWRGPCAENGGAK